MRTRFLSALVLTGTILALQACGGEPDAPVVPPVPPTPVTVTPPPSQINQSVGFDFVLTYIVPQLQRYYGNIQVLSPIQVTSPYNSAGNFTVAPGSYSWAQMYQSYVIRLARNCGCYMAGSPAAQYNTGYGNTSSSANFQGWAYLDFNQFNMYLGAQYNQGSAYDIWRSSNIRFQTGQTTDFYTVVNMLVSTNYVYYSQYYWGNLVQAPSWYQGGYYGGYYDYYGPRYSNSVGGFLSIDNGKGFQLDIGGLFNWN